MKWWSNLKLLYCNKRYDGSLKSYGNRGAQSLATSNYVQGQEPEPKIREYFYFIDHEGMVNSEI